MSRNHITLEGGLLMIKTARVSTSVLLAIVFVASSTSHAQFDHLRCFKIKDGAKFTATATLTALQAQFGIDEACEIKGKGRLFCVPVSKTVTSFIDGSKQGIPQETLDGAELDYDNICYKIKCPKREIAPELVTDQFGSRTVEKFKSQYLCAPAIKGLPPSPTTTLPCQPDCVAKECGDDGCGGVCGTCPAGEPCDAGQCVLACAPSEANCDGVCVDLFTDPANCGACGVACGSGSFCVGGQCLRSNGLSCNANSECLSGFCSDTVCCETACDGVCGSCALPGNAGTCVCYDVNTDPENECPTTSCDGTCGCSPSP